MADEPNRFTVHTDGACIGNPGPGGYGVVIRSGDSRQELSGGFRRTTNNRMEIMAAIVGLLALPVRSRVTLYTDSQYVANAITLGWAKRWRAKGWMRNATDRAVNPDLWGVLLDLLMERSVAVEWVRGHAGNRENERCDRLSVAAAKRRELPVDEGYARPDSSAARAWIAALGSAADPGNGAEAGADPAVDAQSCEGINAADAATPPASPANVGRPWLAQEERLLIERFESGSSVQAIAAAHGRTPGSIRARLIRLGKIDEVRAPAAGARPRRR